MAWNIIFDGYVTLMCKCGEVFRIHHDTNRNTGNQIYWFTSSKGYCSNNYNDVGRAIQEMKRVAKNSDKDAEIEKRWREKQNN